MAEEIKFGVIDSPIDVRDYKLAVDKAQVFPDTFELPMVRIKSQGAVGSCVAHSLSEVVEYYNKKQLNKSTEQSIVYIYGNRRNSVHKGDGMITRDALANMLKYGDVDKTKCPGNYEVPEAINRFEAVADSLMEVGCKSRFSAYYKLNTAAEIKAALMNHGPVVMTITWYDDMEVIDGVLTTEKKNKSGGHCMVIYGWNEKGWLVQNSWGKNWGVNGTCIIPYDLQLKEVWGVTDEIVEDDVNPSDIILPFSSRIGELIAKLLNAILNCIRKLKGNK